MANQGKVCDDYLPPTMYPGSKPKHGGLNRAEETATLPLPNSSDDGYNILIVEWSPHPNEDPHNLQRGSHPH